MSKVAGLVGVVVVAVGGYFGLNAAGIIGGGAEPLSEEMVAEGLSTYAEQINSENGEYRFDGFSKLTAAEVDGTSISIEGASMLDAADLGENYAQSRTDQGLNIVCNDLVLRALLDNGATFNFDWQSADGETIGDTIVISGVDGCIAEGYETPLGT